MRDKFKRVVCFLFVLVVLAANLPLCACADPISAAAISNAFAQAITAYGASNGVSMTFDGIDSNNTEQIGERMHELWSAFRSGQQTADDYETLAAAIFPGLYSKAVTAGGTAVVAVNIAQQYMPDLDDFWNWVLSGPAELTKVDNSYYQLSSAQIGNNASPLTVLTVVNGGVTVPYSSSSSPESLYNTGIHYATNGTTTLSVICKTAGITCYLFSTSAANSNNLYVAYKGNVAPNVSQYYFNNSNNRYGLQANFASGESPVSEWNTLKSSFSRTGWTVSIPTYSSLEDAFQTINEGTLGIVASGDTGVVEIPDTNDPDYGPLPYIGNLPIPWNDTLYGDGTGSLTDAQSDAISKAVDDAIVANPDKTLETEREATDDPDKPTTDDPPSNDPDDYTVPGLQTIFPFCIPFDVYNFLSALAADPVPPHFTATLQFPAAIGGAQTIDIDFNTPTFNQIASILRTLELLAFIVGLALLTRSMFIRG